MGKGLIERIMGLKERRNALILAHNYQIGEVQDIADFVGDSLDLSRKAATTDASVIVFCGVHFMAETAKILSPKKIVLLPDPHAGCPLADMITTKALCKKKEENPHAVVVCYVNSSAEIKAESDLCCTSANAVRIINSIPDDKDIIFIPDKWLGDYISRVSNRRLILWNGHCPTHVMICPEGISILKERYPNAEVLVHPECPRDVVAISDHVFGTNGMIKYVRDSNANEFIIGTEIGILHRLKKENPDKHFYPASLLAECSNMKLINLEKILWSLEEMMHKIEIEENVYKKAKEAVSKMLKTNGI